MTWHDLLCRTVDKHWTSCN